MNIPGLDADAELIAKNFLPLTVGGGGLFHAGKDGVLAIHTPLDRASELIVYADKTLVFINSKMGHPAIYPLLPARFEAPADAVLMDLDGTSVHSEHFWIWVIEQTTARLLGNPRFQLAADDEPHVSGHSVSEHLSYCVAKYCPDKSVEEARDHYFDITRHEMAEIMAGRGRPNAFEPAPGLDEFLRKLKERKIKIGLVTSGLYEKAWPEILSAFRALKLGDPLEFYDAIISAGHAIRKGQAGTLGELAPKPHPWLYAETARVGLGLDPARRHRVIGIEDSGAGVVAIRLAGFSALGITGGNLAASGNEPFLRANISTLTDALPLILG
ncbi:MAG: HAD family phosphatase [Verrucomicrobiales bacterium]|jgi:beta-phosphoglucomutase-like phosphatase (HAD superfamily)|nr:HAD family phosphatase [Verrucomicrobiales bacterium]